MQQVSRGIPCQGSGDSALARACVDVMQSGVLLKDRAETLRQCVNPTEHQLGEMARGNPSGSEDFQGGLMMATMAPSLCLLGRAVAACPLASGHQNETGPSVPWWKA